MTHDRCIATLALLFAVVPGGCTKSASNPPVEGPTCSTEAVRCPDGSLGGRAGPECLVRCPPMPAPQPPATPSE
jgi:hypothetical protein